MEKLRYGLCGDKLVHIDDAEKGLACNCICPHCKTQLVAKKGNHNVKHFAHYELADCNHGTETALHLMAKNIISQTRKIFVPYIPKSEYDLSNRGKIMLFENAILEKQLSDNIRGDIVLYCGNSFLNVEIKVTHKIDTNKVIELFNLGVPTVELDLSDIKDSFTEDLVEQLVLSGKNTHLIYSPKCKEIFAKRILGEWKQTIHNSNGTHVKDCPLSHKNAYFVDYSHKGGKYECHDCNAYINYVKEHSVFDEGLLLCFGCIDGIKFEQIEKIIHLEKEEKHIRHLKLLMRDGSIIER